MFIVLQESPVLLIQCKYKICLVLEIVAKIITIIYKQRVSNFYYPPNIAK